MDEERFWSKVDKTTTCWLWKACCNKDGYGQFFLNNRMRPAHRVSYEYLVGPILQGLELDHLCRIRRCVNPDHLEVVTHLENCRRGEGNLVAGKLKELRIYCPQNHEYINENVYIVNGYRKCKECTKKRAREYYWRVKNDKSNSG